MLTTLAFVLASSFGAQARAFSFLSYQDTIFAVYVRGWQTPTQLIETPSGEVDLKPLGMAPLKGLYKGTAEGAWDAKANCYYVACQDFEHVLGCSVTAQYLRTPAARKDLAQSAKEVALRQLQAEFKARSLHVTLTSVKDPNVYSVDLDGTGHEEVLADISVQAKDHADGKVHSYGLAFLYSRSYAPHTLSFKTDGWPRILSVVDLGMDRDRDRAMDVIVGGTTSVGKCALLFKFNRNQLTQLAAYDTPR